MSRAVARACADLLEDLPEQVADQQRREVEGDGYAAAWGDPAIELRCGVPRPPGLTRFAACQEVDGVGWCVPASQQAGDTVTITTIGRVPRVSVRIPPELSPPATSMVDLGPAVKRELRQVQPCV